MMISQPIFAPAEKQKLRTSRFCKTACAAVLTVVALLPAFPAHGSDGHQARSTGLQSTVALPLPPIPYLETTPWLSWRPFRNGLKVDTLQMPRSPHEWPPEDDLYWPPLALPIS
jgi:hypothetical protein